KDLETIILKALSGEPETRYQTAMELHDDLQAFMFAHGMFYSRKDLAAWMRKQYAREIELDKNAGKAPAGGPRPAPPSAPRKSAPPGPPRPPGKAGPPGARPPGARPPSAPPRGAPRGDALQPSEDQLAAARKRSKTMLMSP